MKKLIRQLYEASIKELEAIKDLAIEYDMLDEQETLNWLDKLNEISIDPNR